MLWTFLNVAPLSVCRTLFGNIVFLALLSVALLNVALLDVECCLLSVALLNVVLEWRLPEVVDLSALRPPTPLSTRLFSPDACLSSP